MSACITKDDLDAHREWCVDHSKGTRLTLTPNISITLCDGPLMLTCACLEDADFHDAYLPRVDFSRSNLRGADLRGAFLTESVFDATMMQSVKLTGAIMDKAVMRGAMLHMADMTGCNLTDACLRDAKLQSATMHNVTLERTDLAGANLSSVEGLLDPVKWMATHFESDTQGYIVFKVFGHTDFAIPYRWAVQPGSVITEVVNPDRTLTCGCGINFGTYFWASAYRRTHGTRENALWRCRIPWADCPGIVVPYNTDGKARCSRLELIAPVDN